MDLAAKTSSMRIFLLLFLGTFTLMLGSNWRYYFASPVYEVGDVAVNALAIDQAKVFREIRGNYSRYHFQHPGPAFFYVYAMAEWALCEMLRTNLPPHCVHSLAGLAVQSAFFALALTIASSWISAPLFPALALLAAALHFTQIDSAFTSVWPPHVLLMPFLAFWVACISVADGRGQHLPWALLSGSFLVHGHVAQPLFVVGLFLCAYGGFLWSRWRAHEQPLASWRAFYREHLWSLAILLVFLLPIALDLLQGSRSNFGAILRHLRNSGDEHKTLADGFFYFLSFFGYQTDQETRFAPASLARWSFLREQVWLYASWLVAVFAGLVVMAGRATSSGLCSRSGC